MRHFKTKISNSNHYPSTTSILLRPERYHQLKNDISPIIARGLGSSPSDASLHTNEATLLMERLNRFLAFDDESGVLTAEAGTSLAEILNFFVPKGWFLPITPHTKFSTLGGCTAVDVHGKNHFFQGSFGHHVHALELVLANGGIKSCSRKGNQDLFWATIGGMGLTGIISEVSLQLIPIESAYISVQQNVTDHLDQTLIQLGNSPDNKKYISALIDCSASGKSLGRSVIINGNHATLSELPRNIKDPLALKKIQKSSHTLLTKTFQKLSYYLKGKQKSSYITHYENFFYLRDSLYRKKDSLTYQFVVPFLSASESLKNILEQFHKNKIPLFQAELKKLGKESESFLSFPKEGFSLSLDIPIKDKTTFEFLEKIDGIVLKYGGRVSVSQDFRMKPSTFKAMYPRLGQWQRIKSKLDPEQRFNSDLSRRLKMDEIL